MRTHLLFATAGVLLTATAAPAQQPACAGHIEAELGFSSMTFAQGTTYLGKSGDYTVFGTEPILGGIDPNGVAAGRLAEGDALVAIDGELITTRGGARRYAGLRPGVLVVLTVRRGGRNLDVPIIPGSQCVPEEPVPQAGSGRDVTMSGHIRVQPTPDDAGRPLLLGIGLSCSYCSLQLAPDGTATWHLSTPPRVESVAPGSAAARAGLRSGDQIVSVDGVAITTADGGRRFGALTPGKPIRIGVLRKGKTIELTAVPGTE